MAPCARADMTIALEGTTAVKQPRYAWPASGQQANTEQ